MSYLYTLIGAALVFNAAYLYSARIVHTGTWMTLLGGLALILYAVMRRALLTVSDRGVLQLLRRGLYACVALGLCVMLLFTLYGARDTATYDEGACIVLGAGLVGERITPTLANRLDRAVEYHTRNPEGYIVVSGGKGPGESVTEASAMRNYLLRSGVDDTRIVVEDRATSTMENMLYSRDALVEQTGFDTDQPVIIISNRFHLFRAVQYAQIAGFHATHVGGGVPWYTIFANYVRETAAIVTGALDLRDTLVALMRK